MEHLINMLYATGNGDPENGWDYVGKLCANLDGKLLSSSSAVGKAVAEGEYAVGLTFEEGAANYRAAGYPVELVYMSEGTVSTADVVAIIKNAKHRENARKFIDFLTGKDAQTMISGKLHRQPVRADVPTNKLLKPSEQIRAIKTDTGQIGERKQGWLNKFSGIYIQ